MTILYRASNVLIGTILAAVCGLAISQTAPQLWDACAEPLPAVIVAFGLIAALVVGLATLEPRKY